MEYFRRCIGQADRGNIQSAIEDVLAKNGFSINNDGSYYYYARNYKKYAINSCDFVLFASSHRPCSVLKRGNFNNEEYGDNFAMSGIEWEGNNTLNFVFIPFCFINKSAISYNMLSKFKFTLLCPILFRISVGHGL